LLICPNTDWRQKHHDVGAIAAAQGKALDSAPLILLLTNQPVFGLFLGIEQSGGEL
jgi:hypothetical protein